MTTSANLSNMYEAIVADLVPFYENQVLLPNQSLIQSIYTLAGATGNTMNIPLQDSFTPGAVIAEQGDIISTAGRPLGSTSVSLAVSKRGAGTYVTTEAMEDIGMDTITNNVVNQLSRSIALATDIAGFRVMFTGAEAALTDISDSDLTQFGAGAGALTTADMGIVFSPEAMAYAVKRAPTVEMDKDVNLDRTEVVATMRNGFARLRTGFMAALVSSDDVAEATEANRMSLAYVAQAVARLRGQNAPADAGGFYHTVVTPAQEYHIASQLNSVVSGTVGDLSMVGNQALRDGLIGQAVGCNFYRSNNLPTGVATA